ncbi:MAG: hypothetical protein H6825_14265 [Planctomycetes bacterium]|nr:hypothetical protein [Planctomycetota bacterium]
MAVTPTRHANTIIFPASLDPKAVSVVRRLNEAGFETYLVGGCVRDLLLGRIPKDFDVSTAARPRQIRRTFRNCRVIGRRFKLAHVHFGEQIIEVATFRRNPFDVLEGGDAQQATDELDDADDHGPLPAASDDSASSDDDGDDEAEATDDGAPRGRRSVRLDDEGDDDDDEESRRGRRGRRRRPRDREGDGTPHAEADGLLIVRDNVYGSAEEDALRRDFTINALLYDVATEQVIDYVGGVADLEARTLRTIGEARTRLAEDPVRMLRAVKFTARLGLHFDDALEAAMRECAPLIEQSSPPRVLEEIYKLLSCGQAESALSMLCEYGLLARLVPEVAAHWTANPDALRRTGAALDVLDAGRRRVSNAIILAALFHDPWRAAAAAGDGDPVGALHDLITPAARRMSIPRRDVAMLKQLFMTLMRFEKARRSRRFRMKDFLARPSTGEAIDFLGLLARAGSVEPEIHARWAQKLVDQLGQDAVAASRPVELEDDDEGGDGESGAARPRQGRAPREGEGPSKRKRRRRGGRGRRRGGREGDAQGREPRTPPDEGARDARPASEDATRERSAESHADGSREPPPESTPREGRASTRAADTPHATDPPSDARRDPQGTPANTGDGRPGGRSGGLIGWLRRKVLGETSSPEATPKGERSPPRDVTHDAGAAGATTDAPSAPASHDPGDVQDDGARDDASPERSSSGEGGEAPRKRRRRRRKRSGGAAEGSPAAEGASDDGGEDESGAGENSSGSTRQPASGGGTAKRKRRRKKRGGGSGGDGGQAPSGDARREGGARGESRAGGGRSRRGEGADARRGGRSGGKSGGEAKRKSRRDDDEPRPSGQGEGPAQLNPEDVEDLFDW